MATTDSRLQAAQKALDSIGLGFDITQDINYHNFKRGSRLILVNEEQCRPLEIPGGFSIPNVPNSIRCVKGESIRIHSEVHNLQQMLEHFNQEMCLGGKIASGHFCASFGLSSRCMKDLYTIKSLAYDGWFIKRYAIELERYHGDLLNHVKEAVPSSWDPEALARFIERFGTHVVVGVSMGGKDVLYVRQEDSSYLHPTSIQKLLEDAASKKFTDSAENHCLASEDLCNNKENLVVIHNRRGGSGQKMYHSEWLDTVDTEPDVISVFLIPLTSLLKSIRGSGFVSHAINLYLRYKPPTEDLHQFFEFQLPRQWAPVPNEIRLGSHWKHQVNSWLRFSILGPKLYINTIPVDVGNRPVTGLRLQLEGRRSNRLAIHLQHLTSLPKSFPLSDNANPYLSCDTYSCTFHKKVKWNSCSYVCTAPVESDDSLSIVTGAQLQVENKCLLLRLRFSKVLGATLQKPPEWEQSLSIGQLSSKNGGIVALLSKDGQKGHPKQDDRGIGSTTFPAALPAPVHTPKLLRFVDTREKIRGPEDSPGHWVVSGAKLSEHNGKIYLHVDIGNRPVTGLRLHLEGTSSNRLAIHLLHLTSLPEFFPLSNNANVNLTCDPHSCKFHKKVKWNRPLYVCTASVESDDSAIIVTGAQLTIERNCLVLRLRFSKVIGATLKKPPEWDQSSSLQLSHNCCIIFMTKVKGEHENVPKPGDVTIASSAYPSGLPAPVHPPKLLRFVDTKEIIRGPQDTPGHWVVSGAKVSVQDGKIYLLVKYSLLNFVRSATT